MPKSLTNLEFAAELRLRAERTSDNIHKTSLLSLAGLYDREDDLVAGTLRAIEESKTLLAAVDRFLSGKSAARAPHSPDDPAEVGPTYSST
jgi:hypothetical protein